MFEEDYKFKFFLMKLVISLANITAKMSFLSTCLLFNVIPSGFLLKFSIQSSLSRDDSKDIEGSIKTILTSTSLTLLKVTLEAETLKSSLLINKLQDAFAKIMDEKQSVLDLLSSKFKRILILRTNLLSCKFKTLNKDTIKKSLLDVDEEVTKFQSNFDIPQQLLETMAPQSPSQDWFDLDLFPPLPTPKQTRPDWTNDVIILSPATSPASPSTSRPPPPPTVSGPACNLRPRNQSKTNSARIRPHSSEQPSAATPSSSGPVSSSPPSCPAPRTRNPKNKHPQISSSPINVVPFSTENFKPLILDDVPEIVSPGIISLLSKGPSFSPSPIDPPDIQALEEDFMDWKERMRWAFFFRSKKLKDDPKADLSSVTPFTKPPWYARSDRRAPHASDEVEFFMDLVRRAVISTENFAAFSSNISSAESKAFKELRILKQQGYPVFLQDKSSRFVIADRDVVKLKVDLDLSDVSKYETIPEDDSKDILLKITSWWRRNKQHLSVVDEDISSWLVNPESKAGKLKVLIKSHKQNNPVREIFSVCGQSVQNLSSFLQFSYLGPIINSGLLKWRLRDTKELIKFLHDVNDQIKLDKITSPISICTLDIKNMFPSINQDLAMPAIKMQLEKRGYSSAEINAVGEALEIVRDGTRVQWEGKVYKQINGCSLCPSDSCDYTDIALDAFLQVLVPRLQSSTNMDFNWLKFFRDDGIFIFTDGDSKLVFDILDILNGERAELQFTTELCPCKNVLGCCQSCPKSVPYLDCLVSVYESVQEDGSLLPQIKTTTYSKPTDVHHYISPSSCTPNLSSKSPAIIKGVAHRLRLTNKLL